MSVDSDRQWFVYYKEAEMGPFPEPELLKKVKAGEFDDTAFVYTDGMSDWELVKDSSLQKSLAVVADLPVQVASSTTNLVDASARFDGQPEAASSNELASDEPASDQGDKQEVKAPKKAPVFGLKTVAVIFFVLLIGAGYVLNKSLIDSYISGSASQKLIDLSEETPLPQTVNVDAAQDSSVNWGELDAFVRIQDPQGPAFRLANKSLGGMRPIIVGALSPTHKHSYVTVALFPDNERALYAVPPLWISDVGVHSGYFSVGPHLNKGQDLLPGRYRVLVASEGKFLGDVSIDIGVFPLGEALAAKKAEIQNEVAALANGERDALKADIQKLVTLEQKLPAIEPLAMEGSVKRRVWSAQRIPFAKELSDLREQQAKVVQGPMFFGADQTLLLAAVSSLDLYVQSLESYSLGGAAEVKTKLNSSVQTLKSGMQAALKKLETAAKDIDALDVSKPLTISAENIKARLLEESK